MELNQNNNLVKTFVKSPDFVLPDPEENKFLTFTTIPYQPLSIPEAEESCCLLYQDIVHEINNKVKEINFSHAFYESTGMITITDSNFIRGLLYVEAQANQNIQDIMAYNNDLLTIRLLYLKKYNRPLLNELEIASSINDIEYYSNIDYFLVFSSQLINVSAHEILDLLATTDPLNDSKINDLLALIKAVQRIINHRISYEVTYHHIDLSTINEFLNQNADLLKEIEQKIGQKPNSLKG